MNTEPQTISKPMAMAMSTAWYREPMVWLVIALPAVALVAGTVMLSYALLHPDVEVHNERRPAPIVTGEFIQRFDVPRPA
jgi:hypothetical protein